MGGGEKPPLYSDPLSLVAACPNLIVGPLSGGMPQGSGLAAFGEVALLGYVPFTKSLRFDVDEDSQG